MTTRRGADEGVGREEVEGCRACPFDKLAGSYDKKIDWDELLMGIKRQRGKLMKNASGSVLEISAGTGRNLPHYPSWITSLTLTDISSPMLQQAQAKRFPLPPSRVHFLPMDAQRLHFPDNSFDTVVDTFGLCSAPHPELILSEMRRVCKKDGKILLLEHGRAQESGLVRSKVNAYLDRNLHSHVRKWGCWWNRDIRKLVRESGYSVVEQKESVFGTTYYYVASPNKGDP
uniref:Methyltransferase type 11 domain-containing protein n=1 Tax=Arcella intermedia TaxID=1963864 RepID=A0A6B2LFX6_9EUKA